MIWYISFVIYADFEAINEQVHRCQPNNDTSCTESYQKHKTVDMDLRLSVVMMISIVNQFRYIEEKMLFTSSWKKCLKSLMVQKMKHEHFNKDMIPTKDERNFKTADKYYIYNKKYSAKDVRVRDHCHVTGKYRGSAHQDCDINYTLIDKIPVIFNSLKGYDSHFIIQTIGEIANKHTYKNKEKGKLNRWTSV